VLDILLGCLIMAAVVGALRVMHYVEKSRKPASNTPANPTPLLDQIEEDVAVPSAFSVAGGSVLIIRYRDSSNQETERRITPKKIRGVVNQGQLRISHIEAYCHARKRSRTFKAERILQSADAETGEVLVKPTDLERWIADRLQA
jgi:hypothetical protein